MRSENGTLARDWITEDDEGHPRFVPMHEAAETPPSRASARNTAPSCCGLKRSKRGIVPSKEHGKRIEAQLRSLQPGWGPKEYDGERKMIHATLHEGENIERLWGGGWSEHARGVIVATNRRVVLLNRGWFSKNVESIAYWSITSVKETGPDKVKITLHRDACEMCLPAGAATAFAGFLRDQMVTGAASVKAAFSHILDDAEEVEDWAFCLEGGSEKVTKAVYGGGPGGGGSPHWKASASEREGLAVATDTRILFIPKFAVGEVHRGIYIASVSLSDEEGVYRIPYGDLQAVSYHIKNRLKLHAGAAGVYVIRFRQQADRRRFYDLAQRHATTDKKSRIFAEWQMQHPVWNYQGSHNKELDKLPGILDDDEHIEDLLAGRYESSGHVDKGIIVATDRRLVFVSGKSVSEMPYQAIERVESIGSKSSGIKKLAVIATGRSFGYQIDELDDSMPNDSHETGYAKLFAAHVQRLARACAPEPPEPAESGQPGHAAQTAAAVLPYPAVGTPAGIDAQWQALQPGWGAKKHRREREKLYGVLDGDENIEGLLAGSYKADLKGSHELGGVVVATGRRVLFVYQGWMGEDLSELPYGDISTMEYSGGLYKRWNIIGGAASYQIDNADGDDARRFAAIVLKLIDETVPSPRMEKARRIDAQWRNRSSGWNLDSHNSELKLLHDILDDDENIERLLAGEHMADRKGAMGFSGVIAATSRRVLFLYDGRWGQDVAEMPYESIGGVEYVGGLGKRWCINGRSGEASYRIDSAEESEAKSFFSCVRRHLAGRSP